MAKIDTSGWKEFIIGDLFEKLQLDVKNKDFNKTLDVSEEKTAEFNLPLVNAKHGNNGIMYYGREADFETAEMTIDIVQNGAIATGDVYAQPQKTGVLWDAYLVKPKVHIDSPYTLIFLATILQKAIKDKFSYDDKCVWDKAKALSVSLPVDASGKPDWAYMDAYMTEAMQKAEETLDALTRADGKKHAADMSGWKPFAIGRLFDVIKGTRLTKAHMTPGDIRFIGSSAMNNGCTATVGNTENIHPANTITVCYNGSVGETFYQDEPFLASDDVNVLYPKFEMTREIALFIIPLIKAISAKYNYVNKWKQEVMIADEIMLPIDAAGEPDWAYMDAYMSDVIRESEASLENLKLANDEKKITI